MHRKKKQSLSHLRCREAVGVDSIAAGLIHWTDMKAEGSDWNVSFWFALSSPLLGVLLGILAAAIFCR
jgi:hypothetical protein